MVFRIGLEPQRLLVLRDCLVELTGLQPGSGEVVVGLAVIGFEFYCALEMRDSILRPARREQLEPQVLCANDAVGLVCNVARYKVVPST